MNNYELESRLAVGRLAFGISADFNSNITKELEKHGSLDEVLDRLATQKLWDRHSYGGDHLGLFPGGLQEHVYPNLLYKLGYRRFCSHADYFGRGSNCPERWCFSCEIDGAFRGIFFMALKGAIKRNRGLKRFIEAVASATKIVSEAHLSDVVTSGDDVPHPHTVAELRSQARLIAELLEGN